MVYWIEKVKRLRRERRKVKGKMDHDVTLFWPIFWPVFSLTVLNGVVSFAIGFLIGRAFWHLKRRR